MDAPNLQWHDRSTADSERYELLAWPSVRAVVTRPRAAAISTDFRAYIELEGQATAAPRSFTTQVDAQEWALREIERRLLRQSTRIA